MGALARRRSFPPSLWGLVAGGGAVGGAAALGPGRPARLSGARPIMIGLLDRLARPFLGLLDAENAHRLAVQGLRLMPRGPAPRDDPRLSVRVFGLNFPNPVGMAAGFDKHSEVPDALRRLRFGFVQVGTVTPRPQACNPRPRLLLLSG